MWAKTEEADIAAYKYRLRFYGETNERSRIGEIIGSDLEDNNKPGRKRASAEWFRRRVELASLSAGASRSSDCRSSMESDAKPLQPVCPANTAAVSNKHTKSISLHN